MRRSRKEVKEMEEVEEMKEAKDKISRIHMRLGDFSIPPLPLLPARLAVRLACPIALFGMLLIFSLMGFSQANTPSEKPSAIPKSEDPAAPLSHDLSGVWMQYRDGDVPGTPGMNGVNEHFRPPLTPWGQAKFDAAKPLSGAKAIAGQEDNSALRCEPSGPPQVLVLPNPWEIVQIPGRVLMFFEEQHIWREIWTDGRG